MIRTEIHKLYAYVFLTVNLTVPMDVFMYKVIKILYD